MPMSTTERAALAARAGHAGRTAAERTAHARKAYFAGAVNTVISRAAELSPEQIKSLRRALREAGRA